MKTSDLFKTNAKKLTESFEKTFGKKLKLETFTTPQLEDARNRLRTQIHQVRNGSNFNETVENEAYTKAQWMLDGINAELAERFEQAGIQAEGVGSMEEKVQKLLQRFEQDAMEIGGYGDPDINKIMRYLEKGDAESAVEVVWYAYSDQDGGEFPQKEALIDDLEADFEELVQGSNESVQTEGVMSEIAAELGQVADEEDYDKLYDLFGDNGPVGKYLQDMINDITGETGLHPKDDFERIESIVMDRIQQEFGGQNDDEGGETDDSYALASAGHGSDEDYESIQAEEKDDGYHYSRGGFGKRRHNDDRNVQRISIEKNESINSQEDEMTQFRESAADKAGAVVVANDMTDKVSRWIEELSGMENDTLLSLGDTIRDEIGQEQAKAYLEAVAPAIQQALQNLKATRETLATGMRGLTGEAQPAEIIGNEMDDTDMAAAPPDEMNMPAEEPATDDFAAAEPAAGGAEAEGRAKRESIDRSSNLLRVLAG